ncbi:hypothetical protein CDAR_458181 [Caerostris darwini]|uniref:Uncharacterized protein n=1 Tax=Caerostris darwini TaxID=1538125 RepID=A0AAV4WW89_9ARAC|nr:hypothetical protein CDAR_458181 [Caerostris darwini]
MNYSYSLICNQTPSSLLGRFFEMAVCWTKLRDISASEASRKGALKNRRRCSRGGGRASSQSHRYHLCAHWCRKRCWDGEIRTRS